MITRSKNINTKTIEKHITRAADIRKTNDTKLEKQRPQPVVEKPTYIAPDVECLFWRLYRWVGAAILNEKPIRRWLLWWYATPLKIKTFAIAITGGRVTSAERAERWKHCTACSKHEIKPVIITKWARGRVLPFFNLVYLTHTKDAIVLKHYCGQCGCPRWKYAELGFKNRLRKWYCPMEKHKSEYPGMWADEYLEQNAHVEIPTNENNRGCSGGG